jgi:branched-chain amino acid transport system substrate-binding protein
MGRARLLAAVGTLLVAAGCGTTPGQRAAVRPTVEVAVVDSFSGPDGAAGQAARNGVQLAVDALNARGGLLGQRVEVVAADGERNQGKLGELVRQQLADPAVRLLVGPNATAEYQSVRPAVVQAGVPSCLTAGADDALAGAPATFRVAPSDRTRAAALVGYLHQSRPNVRKIGLLAGPDGVQAQAMDRALAAEAGRSGLAYAGRAGGGEGDPGPALQQLAGQGAQVVVLPDQRQAAVAAAHAVRQLGLGDRLTLAGFDALVAYDLPALGGDPALTAVVVATNRAYLVGGSDGSWPPAYRAFVGTALREFGSATNGVELQADPAAADCVLEWARAVLEAGAFTGPAVARAWERVYVPSTVTALGVTERPTAADHTAVGQDGLSVYTWARDGGRFRLKLLAQPAG